MKPTITPEQTALVRQSWAQVFPIRETAGRMFYDRLFMLDPALRRLFRSDMAAQAGKLFETLNAIVAQLDESDALARAAHALGRSHAAYGATAAHYATLCEALMWTLRSSLGRGFSAPVQAAWVAAYAGLAEAMLAGAEAGADPDGGGAGSG